MMRRRGFAQGLGCVLVLLLVLASCGGDADDTAGEAAGEEAGDEGAEGNPDRVLKLGFELSRFGGLKLDPTLATSTAQDAYIMGLIYGTLLATKDGVTVTPWLAKSYEMVDPSTVRLELREGMEFSDGTAFDAEAVKAGLLRTRDSSSPTTAATQDPSFRELSEIEVVSPLELVLTLK